MNKKRWIAVGIAIVLLIVSLRTGFRAEQSVKGGLRGFIADELDTEQLSEKVIEKGAGSDKVALIEVHGVIGSGSPAGMFSKGGYDHEKTMASLNQILKDDKVKAMVLSVSSPGGAVYESAELKNKIEQIQNEKGIPVYAVMGSMAASGGYYISAIADKIYASEETITGSIGVIMSTINYSKLLEKIGVEQSAIKSGKHKDIMSASREMTAEERAIIQSMIDSSYDRFVKIIVDGRGMSETRVRELADGRIYDGAQALENGLIDEIGSSEEVLKSVRVENGLENASIIKYENSKLNFSSIFSSKIKTDDFINSAMNELRSIQSDSAPKLMYMYTN